MERLSEKLLEIINEQDFCFTPEEMRVVEKAFRCFKAYESTGLEPEEIAAAQKAMRAALGLACELQAYKNLGSFDQLAEVVQAEKDGRLVVLPCKNGDVLWTYRTWPSVCVYSFCVTAVAALDGLVTINTDKLGVIPATDVGKTVFLSRKAAEAALETQKAGDTE